MSNPDNPRHEPTGDDHSTDLVPGAPPVPVSIWRTPRRHDEPDTALPARLAHRLVAAYSIPGEAVMDLTDGYIITPAADRSGRRHHRGWFTDDSALSISPHATNAYPDGPGPPIPPTPSRRQRGTCPKRASAAVDDLDGSVGLIVASWPLAAGHAAARVRLAWLLSTAAQILRPGGCLAIVSGALPGDPAPPVDLTPVVVAARRVGLRYLQHIVAVRADVEGDQFVYYATDTDLRHLVDSGDGDPDPAVDPAAGHSASGEARAGAHLAIATDLFVFSQAGGPHD